MVSKCLTILALATLLGFGSASFDQDKDECADKLFALAACLNYVGGEAKSPNPDCCAGFKTVVDKSTRCLCVLIKDRNNPNLGLKVNATLALNLPSACHVPVNVSTCIDLLHLAPNSSDAKVFSDFEKSLDSKSSNTTTAAIPTKGTSASQGISTGDEVKPNNGSQGIHVVFGPLLWFLITHLVVFI